MRDFKLRRRFNKFVKDGGAGGSGEVLILTPPSYETAVLDTQILIRLCSAADLEGTRDADTGAMKKAILINIPEITSLADTEWEYISQTILWSGIIEEEIAKVGSLAVSVVYNDDEVYLVYAAGK